MLRLEKLELNGFKSFSSPTEFQFGPGITAIVGPNGCGKSNIADALNWVIGEQSTKSLRAEHMGDVIFNGSDARRPLGMAEVTLSLSGAIPPIGGEAEAAPPAAGPEASPPVESDGNGNGHHPQAASDRRRVLITRRLFRSGESEYLIDGQRARLRDVQELLAAMRVGSGVYAVIEQGRVDSVLSSKPRDRRVLIEEAAGIALYKVRKRQAQTKLEAAEANLLRVNDLLGEIERQVGSLKRQAARARRFARLNAEIDRLERVLVHHDHRRLEESAAALQARRESESMAESAAAADSARADAELEAGREIAAAGAAEHQAARDALHELDRALDGLRHDVGTQRQQEAQALAQITRGRSEGDHVAAEIAEAERCVVEAGTRRASAALEADAAEEALREREAGLRLDAAALQGAESSLGVARDDLTAAAGAWSECRNEIRRLEESLRRARSEAGRIEAERAALDAEDESLSARRGEHAAESDAAERALAAAAEASEQAGRLLREEAARREAVLLEREEKRGRLAALEDRLAGLRSIAAAPEGDPVDLVVGEPLPMLKDLLRPPEDLDRAVDAALRELLRGRLTGGVEEAASIFAALRGRGRGRAVLFPGGAPSAWAPAEAETLPGCRGTLAARIAASGGEVPAAVAPLLSRIVVAESLETALAARAALPGCDLVTVSGEFVSRDGWIEGGAELPEEAGVMTLKRLLDRLAVDADAARARIAELDGDASSSRERLAALATAEEAARRRAADLDRAHGALRHRVESLDEESTRLALRRRAQDGERAQLLEDITRMESDLAGTSRLGAAARDRHDELLRLVESLTGASEELRASYLGRNASIAGIREAAAAARERRAALEAEERHLRDALRDLRRRLERESEETARWQARLDESRVRAAQIEDVLADRMAERILLEGKVASAEAAWIERRQALPGLEGAVRESRRRLEEARERVHALDIEEERLAGDRRGLEARLAERGWPSLDAAVADLTDEERAMDAGTARAALAEIREKRDAMGPVNLLAVEEFRELEERHAFIGAQRRDLEEAIRSLKETIARINRQSRERFLDAFEKIRGHFGELFRTLFGGGRADLRLAAAGDGEDDVLEAGLEISAQPPGKRLQSLSLLSGGEKALTATALLFAIFKYSPSPFCLLDEVDAPLDEANVMRFNALVQSMAAETQFIVVTHNRRTMEAADVLYGVTMEEPGVSRTVSIVMGTEEARREAARTLPEMMRSRHRGNGRARAVATPVAPPADA